MALIDAHGPSNWVRISELLMTRSPKQCRERYHQNLKPTLNHSPISEEEGAYIEQLVLRYGKKWAEIARHLSGRSDNAVKNWWNGGANRRRRASSTGSTTIPVFTAIETTASDQTNNPSNNFSTSSSTPDITKIADPLSSLNDHAIPVAPSDVRILPSLPPAAISTPGGFVSDFPPAVGHRVSLPNIYSGYLSKPSPGGHISAAARTEESQPALPRVVFNSSYTSDSSGFRKSSAATIPPTLDPVTPLNNAPYENHGGFSLGHVRSTSSLSTHSSHRSSYSARKRHDDIPYIRRVSASTAPTSSSRASSVSGLSNSDNEDPLSAQSLSLSRYSLSNSGRTSRRSSHVLATCDSPARTTPLLIAHGSPSSITGGYEKSTLEHNEQDLLSKRPSVTLAPFTTTNNDDKIKISNLLS